MAELRQRIRQQLDELPVVDVHTHLGTGGLWQARHLADLVSYHWVHVELARAAGGRFSANPHDDPEGFMAQTIPHFPAIRNTVNHYALIGILRDLYGFQGRTLTADNWRAADEAVRAHASDPTWFDAVLRKAGIEGVAVCFRQGRPTGSARFVPYENGEYLYAVDSVECLRQIAEQDGLIPRTPGELEERISERIAWLAGEHRVRALHVCPYPSDEYPGWSYEPGDARELGAALARLLDGRKLSPRERRVLISFSADATARAAGCHGAVIQMFHGSIAHTRMLAHVVSNISYWDPQFLQSHAAFFAAHPDTVFDIFLGTRLPSHEAVLLSRVYYNVLVSGAWWHAFTPTTMATMFRDRLEMLPNTAWNAFFSDGYLVEWVYGKLLVTKNVLARVLAEMQAEGYITEDDTVSIARQVLYDTPRRVYEHLTY